MHSRGDSEGHAKTAGQGTLVKPLRLLPESLRVTCF